MEKAATLVMLQPFAPAREPLAWTHAPSQPLMQSLLSQFQTPTVPRRIRRFFQVWLRFGSPRFADHSAYFGSTNFIWSTLSAVDVVQVKQLLHACQRSFRWDRQFSVHRVWKNWKHSGKAGFYWNFRRLRRRAGLESSRISHENCICFKKIFFATNAFSSPEAGPAWARRARSVFSSWARKFTSADDARMSFSRPNANCASLRVVAFTHDPATFAMRLRSNNS